MDPFPAYFLTATTYGTWLHHDPRGSVDDAHNRPKTPQLPPDADAYARVQARLSEPPLLLSPTMRLLISDTLRTLAERRGWKLLGENVRTNHLHLVVIAHSHAPELVLKQCKDWSSRALRKHGLLANRKKVWTTGGSTRWINDDTSLRAAIDYVERHQWNRGPQTLGSRLGLVQSTNRHSDEPEA